jgi:hypothetical protein
MEDGRRTFQLAGLWSWAAMLAVAWAREVGDDVPHEGGVVGVVGGDWLRHCLVETADG